MNLKKSSRPLRRDQKMSTPKKKKRKNKTKKKALSKGRSVEYEKGAVVRRGVTVTLMDKGNTEELESRTKNPYKGPELPLQGVFKRSQGCVVKGCSSSPGDNRLELFMIPKDQKKYKKYMMLIGRRDLIGIHSAYYYICSEHFAPHDYEDCDPMKALRKGALPTLRLPLRDEGMEERETEASGTGDDDADVLEQECEPESSAGGTRNIESVESFKKKRLLKYLKYRKAFLALCDKFLSPDVANIIKGKVSLTHKMVKDKNDYKTFVMNLYHANPLIYKALQKTLNLPHYRTLASDYAFKEGVTELMVSIKAKVSGLSNVGKNCSVLVKGFALKPHLYYNVTKDKLVGLCQGEAARGARGARVATFAVVLMAHGLLEPWTLPIDHALFSEMNEDAISKWIYGIIFNLFTIGLKVRICITNLRSSVVTAMQPLGISVEQPYFQVSNNLIYYVYDPTYLIQNAYCCLLSHEFHFQGSVAKWQDVLQFYDYDSKKEYQLAPELGEAHVRPKEGDFQPHIAVEALSEHVASAIANYVDFGQMDESAMGTVKLLTLLSRLHKILTSANSRNSCEYRKPFSGTEFQLNFFLKALAFLRDLKIIGADGSLIDVKFVKHYQISIRAIMLLSEDLTMDNIPSLCTNNATLSVLNNFLQKITNKSKTKDITAWRLILALKKMFFRDILKPSRVGYCPHIVSDIFKRYSDNLPLTGDWHQKLEEYKKVSHIPLPVKKSDYQDLVLPRKEQIVAIAELVFKKCSERHVRCSSYERKNDGVSYTRYRGVFGEYIEPKREISRLAPDDNFINLLERLELPLEEAFRNYHKTNELLTLKVHDVIPDVNSDGLPCKCFPTSYMSKLYFRLRISHQLKANNRRFRKSSSKELTFRFVKLK